MNIKLYESLVTLKECLKKEPSFIRLEEIEKLLNENEEVMVLSYKKDNALREYEDAL